MYLDAQKIFRFACDFQCCPERDDTVDVGYRPFSDKGIAVPRSVVLPGDVVSRLAILHDCRYAVVVIGRHIVLALGFFLSLCDFCLFLLPGGKLRLQPLYFRLVLIVFLTERDGIFYAGIGYLLDQRFIFLFQCGYLGLECVNLVVRFPLHGIQFRQVQFFALGCGLHRALFGMGVKCLTAFAALVLGRSLPKCRSIRTGHTDCYRLTAFQLLFVGCLIIVPAVGRDIIDIPVFVLVEL